MGVCSYCHKYRSQDEECFGWDEAKSCCGVERKPAAHAPMSNPVNVGDDLVERLLTDAAYLGIKSGSLPVIGRDCAEAASQLAAVTASNKALMAERASIIATKREQIASLMDERNNLADIVNSGIDDVAGAKLDELEERATTAEAQLKAAREALASLETGETRVTDFVFHMNAALNPKAPSA